MLLAQCNVSDLVLKHVTNYLNESDHSFKVLKQFILNKMPVPAIRTELIRILTDAKKATETQVKQALQDEYYKKQLREDKKQAKIEHEEQLTDEKEQKNLEQKLLRLTTLKSNYETTRLINFQTLQQIMADSVLLYDKSLKQEQTVESKKVKKLKELIRTDENKILSINNSINSISQNVQRLDTQIKKRTIHRHHRVHREQARIAYQSSHEGLVHTLSQNSLKSLEQCLQEQQKLIEIKYNELINESERLIYTCFIQQLTSKITEINLPLNEIEALTIILKLMKQYDQHKNSTVTIKDELRKVKQLIATHTLKLRQNEGHLSTLQKNNPNLLASISALEEQNKELLTRLERYTKLHKRLIAPTFLLLMFAFLCSIPLILTFGGIIPLFFNPIMLYIAVSVPPALCLTATIVTGIISLVCYIKAHSNKTTLNTNINTITANTKTMSDNKEAIHQAHELTIPMRKVQIKKEEASKERLMNELEQSQRIEKQMRQQMQNIKPQPHASIFSPNNIKQETTNDKSPSNTIYESIVFNDENAPLLGSR